MSLTNAKTLIRDELQSLMNVPVISSTLDFLRHIVLFFVLPIGIVVSSAVLAASIVSRLHKALFSRYATPEDLYDEAICLLKVDKPKERRKALSNLHLVIKLKREFVKAYIVLATELFYGELQNEANDDRKRRKQEESQGRYSYSSSTRRRISQQPQSNNSSAALEECQQVIQLGLSIDPTNKPLLKLQSELNLVKRFGTSSTHTQMLSIGSFGWR